MASLKQLDIGSGALPAFQGHVWRDYEALALDIFPFEHVDKVCDIAVSPLPYEDDSFDLVTAHQVLEHIPKMLYFSYFPEPGKVYEEGRNLTTKISAIRRNCMIELFNEVYRVLKHDGLFHFDVPLAGTPQYYGDPTHVSEWTPDSINYYSGDYFGFHDDYGHTSKFKKNFINIDPQRDWHMTVQLKAIKPMEPPYEV